jgi:hypothetical protein
MQTVWGRELYTLKERVDNDGTYSCGNGSGIQLGVDPITQHLPQYIGDS